MPLTQVARHGAAGAFIPLTHVKSPLKSLFCGAYNNRNGPERTGMDRNTPEWASITGMDIKIYLFYATKFIILP